MKHSLQGAGPWNLVRPLPFSQSAEYATVKSCAALLLEGSAAGLFAGAPHFMLLAGSAILIAYFWPVFQIAASQSSDSAPTT